MRLDCTVTFVALVMSAKAVFSGALPTLTSPADGSTVAVHTAVQDDFLKRPMSERRTSLEDGAYFSGLRPSVSGPWDETSSNGHTANAASAYPKPVTLSWTGTGPFAVTVRRATDGKIVFSIDGLSANSVDVFNLEINRPYSWTVSNDDGISTTATFTTEDVYPRLLWDFDPRGGIFGIRDIGGAVGLDGCRVRQGVIFRSSELSGCSGSGCSQGASFISEANRGFWLDELGIRFELDLRDSSQAGIMKSPLGTGVGYAQISGSDYGNIFDVFDWQGKISENSDTNLVKKALRTVIECVQEASKHPVVIHCQLGKDRTGTLAFLLEALLGVSEDDARRDWEASFFWYHKNRTNLDAVVDGLANYAGSTLAERTCSYVKSIGITDAEIAAFRTAMLEPTADAAVPTLVSPANHACLSTLKGATTEEGSHKWFFYGKTAAERKALMNGGANATLRAKMGNVYGDHPKTTTFTWSGTGPFTLTIKRRDGSVFMEKSGIEGTSLSVDNFEIAASYTWTVSNAGGMSLPRAFTTEDAVPRLLNGSSQVDYTQGSVTTKVPHGVRDMGGYIGKDGRRARQGLLIRNSAFESDANSSGAAANMALKYIDDTNRPFWTEFIKIKTEIDLRNNSESKLTQSTLGSGVTYKRFTNLPAWKTYMTGTYAANFKKDVKGVFGYLADADKYPISFHCTHGKDRTGMLAFLIGSVLGYSEEDIYRDYEATIFWHPTQPVALETADANGFVDFLNDSTASGVTGTTIQEKAVNFIKSCGVTDMQLDAIREIMLEPIEEDGRKLWTGKTVAVLGDSYSAFDGVTGVTRKYYPAGDVLQESQMWWSRVIAEFDGTRGNVVAAAGSRIVNDCVEGGVSVKSFKNRIANGALGEPDVILVLGGLNDYWGSSPDEDATDCTAANLYAKSGELFGTLDVSHPDAEKIVVLMNNPTLWNTGLTNDFRCALRQAAVDRGYTVVDLDGAYARVSGDMSESHPNNLGMRHIADRVIATLTDSYSPPAHLHQYGAWVTNAAPTTTSTGLRTHTCKAWNCTWPAAHEEEVLPKLEQHPQPERCDYLQTDGVGWLDLDFKPHLRNTRIEVVSTVDAGTSGANAMAWAHSDESAANFYRTGYAFWPSDGHFSYYVSTGGDKERSWRCDLDIPSDRPGVHTVLFGGTDFVVDAVRAPVDELPDNHLSGENVQLFVSRPGNYQASPCVKLYSVKVWEANGAETNLVHHFVPVRAGTGATLCDLQDPSLTPLPVQGAGASFTGGDDTVVDAPTCETTFAYDGEAKRPLADTDDYTVLGDVEATIPGTYWLRVVPNGGRCWADDGSHDARVIEWTITGSWSPVETAFGVSNKITIASQDYCILSFTNTAKAGWIWTVPTGVSEFEFLVVAGGGGGGAGNSRKDYCRKGGGGGAGGVVTGLVANASGTFTVKVGAGGATGGALGANGEKGGDSSLTLGDENYVTAKGGGYGGGARYASTTDTGNAGGSGGSGGGGSSRNGTNIRAGGANETAVIGAGVTASVAFGNAGGQGYGKAYAGGGGGAGGAGVGASASQAADGKGGAGVTFAISGMPVTYACGGGTAHQGSAGDGAAAAMATGNGGAGGHGNSSGKGFYGEAGGSGVVIIRYAVASEPMEDVIRRMVDAAKSGGAVLPSGIAAETVEIAADGRSFAWDGKPFAKPHYVFARDGETVVVRIDPAEATITGVDSDREDGAFVVATIPLTVVGFSYSVSHAEDLQTQSKDWARTAPVAGTGGPLELKAPKYGPRRFYRLNVEDGCVGGSRQNLP